MYSIAQKLEAATLDKIQNSNGHLSGQSTGLGSVANWRSDRRQNLPGKDPSFSVTSNSSSRSCNGQLDMSWSVAPWHLGILVSWLCTALFSFRNGDTCSANTKKAMIRLPSRPSRVLGLHCLGTEDWTQRNLFYDMLSCHIAFGDSLIYG